MKFLVPVLCVLAQPVAADPGLRDRLQDRHAEGQDHWIYNDLATGFAKARESGKPLFVTFRCVPCRDCMGFDELVAGEHGGIKDLAKQFVAVRQVEMKGVDLSRFQFDYDLNWAAMFLNADGTVYARYGTQSAEGADAFNSPESLMKTMRRVLSLHANYPANKAGLVGKRGPEKPYRTALEMPGLPQKERFRGATSRANCIHCHNVHDAEVLGAYDDGRYTTDMLWRYPYPRNIGLGMDRNDGCLITEGKSGLIGSELVEVNGQLITSIADIQWALHRHPAEADSVPLKIRRDGVERMVVLPLGKGWKETDLSWRGSMWNVPPRLRIWLPEPDRKERARHGLSGEVPALVARWINTKEEGGRVASEAGLQTGDLIIEIDGKPLPPGGGAAFNVLVKLNYQPGQKVPLTLFRDGKRVPFELPLAK